MRWSTMFLLAVIVVPVAGFLGQMSAGSEPSIDDPDRFIVRTVLLLLFAGVAKLIERHRDQSRPARADEPSAQKAPEDSYYLRSPDGQTHGPMSYGKLASLWRQSEIDAKWEIANGESGDWQPLERFADAFRSQSKNSPK